MESILDSFLSIRVLQKMKIFILSYEVVRRSVSQEKILLDFMQSTLKSERIWTIGVVQS